MITHVLLVVLVIFSIYFYRSVFVFLNPAFLHWLTQAVVNLFTTYEWKIILLRSYYEMNVQDALNCIPRVITVG